MITPTKGQKDGQRFAAVARQPRVGTDGEGDFCRRILSQRDRILRYIFPRGAVFRLLFVGVAGAGDICTRSDRRRKHCTRRDCVRCDLRRASGGRVVGGRLFFGRCTGNRRLFGDRGSGEGDDCNRSERGCRIALSGGGNHGGKPSGNPLSARSSRSDGIRLDQRTDQALFIKK